MYMNPIVRWPKSAGVAVPSLLSRAWLLTQLPADVAMGLYRQKTRTDPESATSSTKQILSKSSLTLSLQFSHM